MGFIDSLFGAKPKASDKKAYNFFLFFDFIPKKLHEWEEKKVSFDTVTDFSTLIQKNNVWKSLVKDTKVISSGIKQNPDITLYLIDAPSNEQPGEVVKAIIAINPKIRKFEYYTMEFSLGDFAICRADEAGNHYYMEPCKDGNQFGAFVIKTALQSLVAPKQQPSPQPKSPAPKAATPKTPTKHTAESFLKVLEKIAEQYYKERGVVSLEDWIVTQKTGDEFKFYITQNPDMEFEDPNCEVTLMVEFMDHNGRMEVVNKFFPKKSTASNTTKSSPTYPSAIADKYYSLDQLRQIQMGEIRLQPIDAGIIFNEEQQQVIQLFAEKSPRVKKYLPNLDLSSTEAIAKYFSIYCQKTEMGLEFGYAIKMNKYGDAGTIGFIFIHTPGLNQVAINFPQWTIDFCLFEPLEGKAIMRTSILRVLDTLKNSMGIKNVFAIVDEDNTKCLRLMSNLPFDLQPDTLTDPTNGKKAKLFMCPLHLINFQRR